MVERIVTRVDKCAVASRQAGKADRPAYVLLHGWPESSRSCLPLMKLLADEYLVLAPDLPGVAGSRGQPATGAKKMLAQIVHAIVQLNEARSVILVGNDVGGMI